MKKEDMQEVKEFLLSKHSEVDEANISREELGEMLNSLSTYVPNYYGKSDLAERVFFKKRYRDFALTIDCLILWNLCLNLEILEKLGPIREDKGLNNLRYFSFILIHTTNNLIGVKQMLEVGLDSQARALYRNSIEMADLGLVCLYDEQYFKDHATPNEGKTGNPYISPKNSTLRKKVVEILEDLHKRIPGKVDSFKTIKPLWVAIRDDHYSMLSESTHGNYLHNILHAYKYIEGDRMIPSLGGGCWNNLELPLSDICIHQISYRRYLTWCLDIKHDIDLLDNSKGRHAFIYFLDVVIGQYLIKKVVEPRIEEEKQP
ncbi:MAG: hypothetical protein ACFHU9_18165 [Fluviicola sp.]